MSENEQDSSFLHIRHEELKTVCDKMAEHLIALVHEESRVAGRSEMEILSLPVCSGCYTGIIMGTLMSILIKNNEQSELIPVAMELSGSFHHLATHYAMKELMEGLGGGDDDGDNSEHGRH